MLGRHVRLGTVFGIPIQFDWSVLVILSLIVVQLAFGAFPLWHPNWSGGMSLLVAMGAGLVFLFSILAHEMAHALMAMAYGARVESITLWMFGGVAAINEDSRNPAMEFFIAVVGPLMSILLGAAFLILGSIALPHDVLAYADDPLALLSQLGPLSTILLWAAPINIVLGVFNLLPAFPMDGGRIFRAAVWAVVGDVVRATRIAASLSMACAWTLIGLGILMAFGLHVPLFGSGVFAGLWVAVLGWFVLQAARSAQFMVEARHALRDFKVGDLVGRWLTVIPRTMPLSEYARRAHLRGGQEPFAVSSREGRVLGFVWPEDLHAFPPGEWSRVGVGAAMRTIGDVELLWPDDPATEAFDRLVGRHADGVIVLGPFGEPGLVTMEDVARWLERFRPRRPAEPSAAVAPPTAPGSRRRPVHVRIA